MAWGSFLAGTRRPIEAFNSPAAQQLLPGKVKEQVPREEGNTYLVPQNYQHPILRPFAPYATRTPWSKFPVYRYWRIDDLAPDASTLIAYSDGRPALLERTIRAGQVAGHVLDDVHARFRSCLPPDAWNGLPGAAEIGAAPFLILAHQIMSYLVQRRTATERLCRYDSVSLPISDPPPRRDCWRVRTAQMTTLPPAEKAELAISAMEQVGNYLVHSVGEPPVPDRGFSVTSRRRRRSLPG